MAHCYLWLARPRDIDSEQVATSCLKLLDDSEIERWHRFRFESHRREFLASRVLLRSALSYYGPLAPHEWEFTAGPHGKPCLKAPWSMKFNIAHCGELVVCVLADNLDVGVDAEPFTSAHLTANLDGDIFSKRERNELQTLDPEKRRDRSLSLWTMKEAYVKGRGTGLNLPLAQYSFLIDPDRGMRLACAGKDPDDACPWQFCLLDYAGHRVAVFANTALPPSLHILDVHPLLAPPRAVNFGPVEWFPRSTGG